MSIKKKLPFYFPGYFSGFGLNYWIIYILKLQYVFIWVKRKNFNTKTFQTESEKLIYILAKIKYDLKVKKHRWKMEMSEYDTPLEKIIFMIKIFNILRHLFYFISSCIRRNNDYIYSFWVHKRRWSAHCVIEFVRNILKMSISTALLSFHKNNCFPFIHQW